MASSRGPTSIRLPVPFTRNTRAASTAAWRWKACGHAGFQPSSQTAINGRTIMPTPAWTVNNGPVKYPLWAAGSPHVTLNGVNYVLMVQDPVDPALASPTNPLGVTTVNGSFYLQSEALNRGLFGMNS